MNKNEFYQSLLGQVKAIISDESDVIANMANISAILFNAYDDVNWAGFYRMLDGELVLGPFQGQVACIRIPVGRGVCGTAVSTRQTQLVADVHQFTGHIACDALSNSEIVIPVFADNEVIAVLDIDSVTYNRFDDEDKKGLEAIVEVLQQQINNK
ncbi:GAF domain-containing protein [Thalassomonas sp. M1454]|uniref:GAF domain-containing protein n=1 Tax=Thalassomonas sp. M1454 TaxID=2594477 RepID=UPI00118131B3|nr:GAF domain-containing protein [Thalassomonas sp. M1454]TRX56660.1 GAF domain-containing protein [Thalassomonas sp. M1454]